METVIYTEAEEVTFSLDLEAEITQDAIEQAMIDADEDEQTVCCYSPNRHCEIVLEPHVWDEMQFLFDEWADNFFAAPTAGEAA